jgi:hypothetical protein
MKRIGGLFRLGALRTRSKLGRSQRKSRGLESLEGRRLLAGDLVGHWLAEDLSGELSDGDPVTAWTDRFQGRAASAVGQPTMAAARIGGRAAVRFDASDGDDALLVSREQNPTSGAAEFSLVVAFATDSQNLVGTNGSWFQNTGIVDGSNLGLAKDWGLSINQAGQLSAGLGGGFNNAPSTVYSTSTGYHDGQLHVATFTRSGSQISLYVDDQPVASRADADADPRANLGFSIGRLFSQQLPFSGDVAEVRFYDGALSAGEVATITSEIQAFYNNSAPVPVDDNYTLVEDTPFYSVPAPGVLGNDLDSDGDALTAELVDPPAHGSLALQPNGSFVYAPHANFFGTDSFTYRAWDFRGSETQGTVTIQVTPVYDQAQAAADSYKALPSQTLTVSAANGVLANDQNIDQVPLTAVISSNVTAGQLTLNDDGSFVYNPQGFAGVATFAYRVDDQTELSSPATVTLVVNTPPAPVQDTYQMAEDATLNVTAANGVLANDVDPDGDALTVVVDAQPAHGQLTLNSDGSFQYSPEPNYFGPDLFSYRVTDGVDTAAATLARVTVQSVNDSPIAEDDAYFALPGNPLSVTADFGLLANDHDVETTQLSAVLVDGPSSGSVTVTANGAFTYTGQAGFVGSDSFTYRAHDGQAQSNLSTVSISVTPQPIVISEIMASNAETLATILRSAPTDEFEGEQLSPDWIEVRNYLSQSIDIGGLHLTDSPDEPMKWQFPSGTIIPAAGYLVVFASGRDIRNSALDQKGLLHTNFQLGTDGEYLAITSATGEKIDAFDPFPIQRTHITYGIGSTGDRQYFLTPSPGAENGDGLAGLVADTQFSVDRGFFQEPFSLTISSGTPDAQIRYTMDGSVPTETTGALYEGPVTIAATTTIRARAFHDGLVATNTDTHSYLFAADVVEQDTQGHLEAGFPAAWRGTTADYGLDSADQFPLIAGNADMPLDDAKSAIEESLLSIPTLSIVMNLDDMFGNEGIYANPERSGPAWERPTSVELIHPDGTEGFQIDSGIRIQGGAFRSYGLTKKKSFRLLFKTTYGPGSLDYPLFGSDAVDEFQTLTLRMESNDGWQWGDAGGQPQYARDEFLRRTHLAMGQPAPHGRNMHLYINGMYWGMYNVVERPDESFGEAYFGSYPYDWDGQNSGSATNADGDSFRSRRSRDAWQSLTSMTRDIRSAETEVERTAIYLAAQGLNADGTDNSELPKYLDPVNYADYLIANYYGGNNDWPFKNYYFGRENSDDSDGFKFFMWDAEWALFLRSNQSASLVNNVQGVAVPFQGLKTSEEFRLLFADRVHKHFFNGGALYVDPANPNWDPDHPERNRPAATYVEVTDEIYDALIAESARWGDQHRARPYTRDEEWRREFDRIVSRWFPERTFELLEVFKSLDLYPQTSVPTFNQRGGLIASDADVSLAAEAGTIYYTLDGSDPRAIGGGVSPEAIPYTGPFRLNASATVRVRALDGSDWSAIDEAEFRVGLVPASSDNLRVAEVHYNPGPVTASEIAAGFDDKDDFEFIELLNISSQPIDLTQVRFASIVTGAEQQGVDFDFSQGTIKELAPGGRVLIVENLAAFTLRYGDQLPVAGAWSGGLSNRSEMITVMVGDSLLQQFSYRDDWHPSTDGIGASLEVVNASSTILDDWNQPAAWSPSSRPGGTPGTSAESRMPGDVNRDGIFNSADLVVVFAAGEYEDDIANNSTFEEGDWNGDGEFNTSDLVLVIQLGNYVHESQAETRGLRAKR